MPPKQLSTLENDKKRCRKSVTLRTKVEVLRRIEAGEKIVQICKAMGLAKSTIQTIRDKKEDIKTYLQTTAPLNVSRLTRRRNWIMEKMEKLLFIWIEDNKKLRTPMSQMTIQEKALSIFENLKNGDTDESAEDVTFQASRGWFEKFKKRFNLHSLKTKGEAASTDEAASKEYPNILKRVIDSGGYKPELEADCEPLSHLVLIQLKAEPVFDEETESVVSKELTSKNLSKAFSYFEQGINILLENDPDVERSAKVSRGINSAISCYKSLKNGVREKPRQTTLDNFFKASPSLLAKNDDNDLLVTISS